MKLWIHKVYRVTASVIYRWPLYASQLNSKYKGKFLGSCSVTVVQRVTIIYRFDCIQPPVSEFLDVPLGGIYSKNKYLNERLFICKIVNKNWYLFIQCLIITLSCLLQELFQWARCHVFSDKDDTRFFRPGIRPELIEFNNVCMLSNAKQTNKWARLPKNEYPCLILILFISQCAVPHTPQGMLMKIKRERGGPKSQNL